MLRNVRADTGSPLDLLDLRSTDRKLLTYDLSIT